MNDARSLWNNMKSRNVVAWTSMIVGYAQNGNGTESIALFTKMHQEGIQPDHYTYTIILTVCADLSSLSL